VAHFSWHSFISFFDIFLPSQAAIASGEQEANTAVPGSIIGALLLATVGVALAQHEGDGVHAALVVWASALEITRPPSMHKIIITLFIGNQFVCELLKINTTKLALVAGGSCHRAVTHLLKRCYGLPYKPPRLLLCRVNKTNHVTILLIASTLAMIGLVFFQYKWISHSRKLSEEIFSQRASMALCSTLEEYGGGAACTPGTCGAAPVANDLLPASIQPTASRQEILENEAFREDLRKNLDFYNIDLNYQISQSSCRPQSDAKNATPACVVNIPPHTDQPESFVTLAFPEKEKFMSGNLKYMIGASMLILLFTAIVLWLANWWLMKQKKLLSTNAEIYNSMAHEFRTPLTNIQLAASLLSKDPASPGNVKLLDIITKENSRLIQQVERVLHLARIDNGDYALKSERMPVKALVASVIDDMQMQIEEKKAIVSLDQIPDTFEITGDRQHLTNAFRNLIDNALKYSVEKPVITILAREEQDGILISFQDNGIGIPASRSNQIFDKFHRIQDTQVNEQKGFGLGLAYVKRIIELHKGFIKLDCGMQQGSCFNVYLPKHS